MLIVLNTAKPKSELPVHLEPGITDTLVKAGLLSCFSNPPPCYCAGIFAFKCSRAEEIFNLLQDLMQCNSINIVEEPVVITRNSHPTERELSRTPQAPNSKAPSVSGEKRGEHRDVSDVCSCSCETALTLIFVSMCALCSVFILRLNLSPMWCFVSKGTAMKSPSNNQPSCHPSVGFHLKWPFLSNTYKDQMVPRGNCIWKNLDLLNSCHH